MSIVQNPSARTRRCVPQAKQFLSFTLKVTVPTEHLSFRHVNEFLQFLIMVYGNKIRITTKNTHRVEFVLFLFERTDAGLCVASWLYGFDYETARVYA
jgi:hypothetical protein